MSHGSAAALWGLSRSRMPIEAISRSGRRERGLLVRKSRIHPEDRTEVDAIPATSVPRTLLDLAGIWDGERVERAWEEADRLGLLELHALQRVCERARGRKGSATIRRVIVELDGFEFHGHRAAFERDRTRDAALLVAGYRVLHLTHLRLESEPDEIVEEIRSLLGPGRDLGADPAAFRRS